jgi:hypothetical protein
LQLWTERKGKVALIRGDDGLVRIEVRTKPRVGELVRRRRVRHSLRVDDATYEVVEISELDRLQSFSVGFGVHFHKNRPRYPWIAAVFGLHGRVEHPLDLSEEGRERELLEAALAQNEVPVLWVNESYEGRARASEDTRELLRQALRDTVEMTRAAWRDELAELAWRDSASYDPTRPRPRRHKPRVAEPPAIPIPAFAARSGELPKRGKLELAGVDLPAGKRVPRAFAAYWATNEPVGGIEDTLQRLRAVFPETGLWPLCWRHPENPDAYMGGHGDIDRIDDVDVLEVMRSGWQLITLGGPLPPFTDFPGLAPPAAGVFEQSRLSLLFDPGFASRVLLVPCNRPADVVAALGGLAAEVDPSECSAVLRSWEERFGTVPVEVAPSRIWLGVTRPPDTKDAALRLAAEHAAFCPPELLGEDLTLSDLADAFPRRSDTRKRVHVNALASRLVRLTPALRIGWGTGGYAQLVSVAADAIIPIPDTVGLPDAAALLADGRRALSLMELARVEPGAKVLVEAAAGGVGTLMVQLAKHAGAPVSPLEPVSAS